MCLIDEREDRKEIDRVLLERAVLKRGVTTALAEKIGCTRQVVWNHRKFCLGMDTRKNARTDFRDLSLEEKGLALGDEARRLQQAVESGMPEDAFNRAMRALALRIKLFELEGKLAGRLSGGNAMGRVVSQRELAGMLREAKTEQAEEVPTAEEIAAAQREHAEVCGVEA
jgi:hypothetical protein